MSDYRFFVNEHDGNGEPTIYRASLYDMHDESGDTWSYYWDGDGMVAVINGYRDGWYGPTKNDDTDRVRHAIHMHEQYGLSGDRSEDVSSMLTRLARRLTGNWDSTFVCVSIDRGSDLYALSWDEDPDHTWRSEIQAVAWGDVWRIEVEQWMGDLGWGSPDFDGNEYYGESVARGAFEKGYPLAEFPAHLTISEQVGA